MEIAEKVASFCERNDLLQAGQTLIIACSGGPDSMTLLHLMATLRQRWNLTLVAAYVHHGLRAAADKELVFVEAQAKKFGARFCSTRVDVAALAKERGVSAEAAGRVARYAFFADCLQRFGAAAVAVGHHADDQAETVLLHLLRGGGTSGAAGMQPKNGSVIRPLLCLTRDEIRAYIRDRGLPYCIDESNEDRRYTRNRIRLDLLPLLKAYNPSVAAGLNRFAEISRAEDDYLAGETEDLFARLVRRENGEYYVRREALQRLHPALGRRLIRRLGAAVKGDGEDISFDFVERVRDLLAKENGKEIRLKKLTVSVANDEIRFAGPVKREKKRAVPTAAEVVVQGTGEYALGSLHLCVRPVPEGNYELQKNEFFLAPEYVNKLLSLRYRRGGERIYLKNGHHKSLKKYFNEKKVPAAHRGEIPLLCDGNAVLFVFGRSADINLAGCSAGAAVCTFREGHTNA
ncbi:tRNA lysidine(34) synthetase TilS [Colibacter massiliensis]|uniref:tRNA lysidine(34) synthetase TilS n=1 Tax=Colibacter massiliensis TaxID=1852379 RepID=UPI003F90ACCD